MNTDRERDERRAATAAGAAQVIGALRESPWSAPQEGPRAPRTGLALREAGIGGADRAPRWPAIPQLEGADVAAIRDEAGLTQTELAGILGVSVGRLGKLEQNAFPATRLERQVLDHLRRALALAVNGADRRAWAAGVAELAAHQGPVMAILCVTAAAARGTPGAPPPLPQVPDRGEAGGP